MWRYLKCSFAKLRPGGSIAFQVIVYDEQTEKEPKTAHPYPLRHYRRADVEGILRKTGFEDIRTVGLDGRPDHGLPKGDVTFVARRPALE